MGRTSQSFSKKTRLKKHFRHSAALSCNKHAHCKLLKHEHFSEERNVILETKGTSRANSSLEFLRGVLNYSGFDAPEILASCELNWYYCTQIIVASLLKRGENRLLPLQPLIVLQTVAGSMESWCSFDSHQDPIKYTIFHPLDVLVQHLRSSLRLDYYSTLPDTYSYVLKYLTKISALLETVQLFRQRPR